jgi:hypothetical protein
MWWLFQVRPEAQTKASVTYFEADVKKPSTQCTFCASKRCRKSSICDDIEGVVAREVERSDCCETEDILIICGPNCKDF